MVGINPSHLDACCAASSHRHIDQFSKFGAESQIRSRQEGEQNDLNSSASWKSAFDFGDFRPEPPRAPIEEIAGGSSNPAKQSVNPERRNNKPELEASLSWKSAYDFGDFRPEPPSAPLEIVTTSISDSKAQQYENSTRDFGEVPSTTLLKQTNHEIGDSELGVVASNMELEQSLSWRSAYDFGDFRPDPPKAPLEESIALAQLGCNNGELDLASTLDKKCASQDAEGHLERTSSWASAYDFGDFRPEPPKAPLEETLLQHALQPSVQGSEIEGTTSCQSAYTFGDCRPEPINATPENQHAPLQMRAQQHSHAAVANDELERSSSWHSAYDFGDFRPEPSLAPPEEAALQAECKAQNEDLGGELSLSWRSAYDFGDFRPEPPRAPPEGAAHEETRSEHTDALDRRNEIEQESLEVSRTLQQEPFETFQEHNSICEVSLSRNSIFNGVDSCTDKQVCAQDCRQGEHLPNVSNHERQGEEELYEDSEGDDHQQKLRGSKEENHDDHESQQLKNNKADQASCAGATIMLSPTPLRVTSSATAFLVQALQSPEEQKDFRKHSQGEAIRTSPRLCQDGEREISSCGLALKPETSTIVFPRHSSAPSKGPAVQADGVVVDWDRVTSLLPSGDDVLSCHKRDALFARWDRNGDKVLSLEAILVGIHQLLGQLLTDGTIGRAFDCAYRIAPKNVDFTSIQVLDSTGFRLFLIYARRFLDLLRHFAELDMSGEARFTVDHLHKTKDLIGSWGYPGAFEKALDGSASVFSEQKDRSVTFDVFAHWLIGHCVESSIGQERVLQKSDEASQDECETTTRQQSVDVARISSSAIPRARSKRPSIPVPSQKGSIASARSQGSVAPHSNSIDQRNARPTSRSSRANSRASSPSAPSQKRSPSPSRLAEAIVNASRPPLNSIATQNARPHSAGQSRRSTLAASAIPRPPSQPGTARMPQVSHQERQVGSRKNARSSSLPPLRTTKESTRSVQAPPDREALRSHLRQHTQCTRARLEACQRSDSKDRHDRDRHDCVVLGPVPGWRRL
eukprot:CAMPEP_0169093206 /NCGR_PEP_ID=MMETSP1015-20121227/17313_1 /TAXON_ID=342587 /ORGANISM="Karlodinium micrum, Strain CCMP2283" /LENGTH=1029 /DNA_ID=CAMNT_0009153831 /DNA_START=18 /DNA_END=3107 /DNA_ORIENTATION=+